MEETGKSPRRSNSIIGKIINSGEPLYIGTFIVSFISWGIVLAYTHSELNLHPVPLASDITGATVGTTLLFAFIVEALDMVLARRMVKEAEERAKEARKEARKAREEGREETILRLREAGIEIPDEIVESLRNGTPSKSG